MWEDVQIEPVEKKKLLKMEDNTFIVNGPDSYVPIPAETIGKLTFDRLIVKDCKQIAMVSWARWSLWLLQDFI